MIDPLYYLLPAFTAAGFATGFAVAYALKHPEAFGPVPTPVPKSPAPDAMTTEAKNLYCEQMGHPNCYELQGTIAGVYKEEKGNFYILVRPRRLDARMPVPPSWGNVLGELLVFVRAAPGYEDKIIVPKPGTHVQLLQDAKSRELAYFIGIIN